MSQETMRAFVLTGHGDLDKLEYRTDYPKPTPGPLDVLVKVGACGLNNTDVNTRTGWYSKGNTAETTGASLEGAEDDDASWGGSPLRFPRIQGIDAVGVVEAVGPDADQTLLGKRVLIEPCMRDWDDPLNFRKTGFFGSECDGAFAEYTIVDHRYAEPIESDLSDAELATFPCSYLTAENMLNRAGVNANDRVLITGASGGVGSALIQLIKRRGAQVAAIASASKLDQVKAIGADVVISRDETDLAGALKTHFGEETVSVVADLVGGSAFPGLLELIEWGGRYVTAGAIAGPIVDLDLRTLYLHDLTAYGATVVPPGTFAELVGYIERGEIKPLLAASYPLSDLKEAQAAFITKQHVGNLAVIP